MKIRNLADTGATITNSVNPINIIQNKINEIANKGFPNYFGSQRMGYQESQVQDPDWNLTQDPDEHFIPLGPTIGKLLLCGLYGDAINAIILGSAAQRKLRSGSGSENIDKEVENRGAGGVIWYARELYLSGASPSAVFNAMPKTAVKERIVLKAMIRMGWRRKINLIKRKNDDHLNDVGNSKSCKNENENDVVDDLDESSTKSECISQGVEMYETRQKCEGNAKDRKNRDNNDNNDDDSNRNDTDNRNDDCHRINYHPKNNTVNMNDNDNDGKKGDSDNDGDNEECAGRVLSQLPYSSRSLWVSSYQSWLWNRAASHRLLESPNSDGRLMVIEGDLVFHSALQIALKNAENIRESMMMADGVLANDCNENQQKKESVNLDDNNENNSYYKSKDSNCINLNDSEDKDDEITTINDDNNSCTDDNNCNNNGNDKSDVSGIKFSTPFILEGSRTQNITQNSKSNPIEIKTSIPIPTPLANTSNLGDTVIVLTAEHISILTLIQREELFKLAVVLPLFGRKMIYPENANGL